MLWHVTADVAILWVWLLELGMEMATFPFRLFYIGSFKANEPTLLFITKDTLSEKTLK